MIIGCVDPRVDPMDIFKLKAGEAAVIRNVGGRIDKTIFETMAVLGTVAKVGGNAVGEGWNLIVLHHTDCGIISGYKHSPDLLAQYLRVEPAQMENMAMTDPYKSVAIDVAALKANPKLPGGFMVSGVVYDVATGRIEIVVPPARLREESGAAPEIKKSA